MKMTNPYSLKPIVCSLVLVSAIFVSANSQAISYSATFAYDIANGKVTKTDPDDRTLVYQYDAVNRLDSIEFSNQTPIETIDYIYEPLSNNLEEVSYHGGSQVFGYDSFDRVITITDKGVTPNLLTTFRYDHKDRVTWIEYPDTSKVCYEYDPDSRITRVGRGQADASMDAPCGQTDIDKIDYVYDNRGRLSKITRPNDIESFIEYYDETGLVRIAGHQKANGGLIYSDRYVYFPNTNLYRTIIRTTPEGLKATKYTYDAYKRLETVKEASGRLTTFTYDAFGNRRLETIACPANYTPNTGEKACGTYRYAYTAQSNRLETIYLNETEIESFLYNDSGRITRRTKNTDQVTRYDYDDRGLLTLVTHADLTTTSFTYDGLGVRKSKTINGTDTTYYATANLFGFSRVLMEVNPTSSLTPVHTYAYGGHSQVIAESTSENNYLLHEGTVGSVSHTFDEAGQLTGQYDYDPFGKPLNPTPNRFGYTGEQYDSETGLLYLRARYYDPSLGRFISADPFWGRLEDPVSQNRFIYVHNNPLLYTDPSGLATVDVTAVWIDGAGASKSLRFDTSSGNIYLVPALGVGYDKGVSLGLSPSDYSGDARIVGTTMLPTGVGGLTAGLEVTVANVTEFHKPGNFDNHYFTDIDYATALNGSKAQVGARLGGSVRYEEPIKIGNAYDGANKVSDWFTDINNSLNDCFREWGTK